MAYSQAMRAAPLWVLATTMAIVGCIDIPAPPGDRDARVPDASPCSADDRDCDGWPGVSTNPAANDCNDLDPDINPGEIDDAGDLVDEDCIDGPFDGVGALAGTSYSAGRLRTDDLDIAFDPASGMPSSMRIASVESLHQDAGGCIVGNEEGLGISLYPTFAAHVRTGSMIDGTVTVERDGPAVTTVLVAWTRAIPGNGSDSCDVASTLTAEVRFHALPGGRILRDDAIVVDAAGELTSCRGCASPGGTAPIFTSYVSLEPSIDQIAEGGGASTLFSDFATQNPTLPIAVYEYCLSSQTDNRKLGLSWHFQGGGAEAGLRARTVGPATTLVYDWRRSTPVQPSTYRAITAMFAQNTAGPCSPEMWETLAEHVTPAAANADAIEFDNTTGLYRPMQAGGNSLAFTMLADIHHGFGVRLEGLGAAGLTAWRDGVRLEAGTEYLIQRDDDGAYTVWLPTAAASVPMVIAGPGGEPAP